MADLGVGIIGCGNISAAYLRLAPMFKGYDIRAVADINLDAAKARAEEFGVQGQSVEDLLSNDTIDLVINLTIPAAHFDVSQRILQAGKHVYSEKPFVLTRDEGQALAELADQKGLQIGSAPDTFMGGSHQFARALVDEGQIGKVTSGTAVIQSHGMEDWHPNPDFFFQPGAGPVLDIGPYYISNLVQLIGPVARVTAFAGSASATRTIGNGPRLGEEIPVDTPTTIHAVMEFESGAIVTLLTSWDVWSHGHSRMELYGTEGTMYLPDPNFFGGDLTVTSRKDAAEVTPWDHPFSVVNDGEQANYRGAGLADMALAIAEGRPHRCSNDFALHVVDIMTSILAAAETGRVVDIATRCTRPTPLGPDEAAALMTPQD
ncbi:Gfo/Idh/MocA family protein [Cognatishimia maritima]|uniref:Predicted dehydrogenase n=1 Tax=Cognatishimia maritima TaxID=870908 RepID=A0A1M5N770_9RHOB|nr:Gfo/Idh/MocA family oxidoreductase [Cognatishimia maritima]SHG85292.1 Predicted dehydrogenase [Cognatishimia maritima]